MHLKTISNEDERFVLLDLDKPWQLAQVVGLKPESPSYASNLELLVNPAAQTLTEKTTGVILGPRVSFSAVNYKDPATGLILSLDDNFYPPEPEKLPHFLSDWGVEHIKNNYGVIKLTLFYDQKEELANEKRKLLAEVYDYAQYEKVDLIVELNINLPPKLKPKEKQELFFQSQLTAVRELQNMVDLFILEFPQTPLACATLTAEIDVPWLMNDMPVDYAQLKENLRIALDGGASGVMLNQTFLSQAPKLTGKSVDEAYLNAWKKFISTEARDRVLEISRIVSESNSLTSL